MTQRLTVEMDEVSAAQPANREEMAKVVQEVADKLAGGFTSGSVGGRATWQLERVEE